MNSPMIDAEIQDLFNVTTPPNQLQYLFGCHVSALINRRANSSNQKEMLKYCYSVAKSLELEQFFTQFIKKRAKFEDNEIFRNLDSQEEGNLIQMVGSCGLAY